MPVALAQGVFVLFNVLALPLVVYALYEPVRIITALHAGTDPISVDSGTQYLILMSVFWPMFGLQIAGLKGRLGFVGRWGSKILIGWFIACLIIATLLPVGLHSLLEKSGYSVCPDPAEFSRLSVGDSLVYVKHACPVSKLH